jgi:hypothetical protein
VALRCDICGRSSPDRSLRCECGYDFATGEVTRAIELASDDKSRAMTKIGKGVAMTLGGGLGVIVLGALAVICTFAGAAVPAIVFGTASWLSAVGCIAGLVRAVAGVRDRARAARLLDTAEAKRALPEARVVR